MQLVLGADAGHVLCAKMSSSKGARHEAIGVAPTRAAASAAPGVTFDRYACAAAVASTDGHPMSPGP